MSTVDPNVAASVPARPFNVAKALGIVFKQVLVRFALERILYRMTQSPHADRLLPGQNWVIANRRCLGEST